MSPGHAALYAGLELILALALVCGGALGVRDRGGRSTAVLALLLPGGVLAALTAAARLAAPALRAALGP